jgi:hypothetical protein
MATEAEAWQQVSASNATNSIMHGVIPKDSSALPQSTIDAAVAESQSQTSERLYQVQARSARGLYNGNPYNDRGDIASIRLVNSNNNLEGIENTEVRYATSGIEDASVYHDLIGITNQSKGYDRFLLVSCDVSYSEKVQIMTTFGDNEVVYFFGKNPVVMNLQGMLIDSLTNDWLGPFVQLYQTFLRGTQLAKNFEMIELVLPNMKVIGSILSLSHQQNSARDTDIPFNMQFYAKQITMLPQPTLGTFNQNLSVSLKASNVFAAGGRYGQGASLASTTATPTVSIYGQKYTALGSGSTGGFTEPTWLSNPGKLTDISNSLATGYTWFRNNISSPVVSVIATLTKAIQTITKDITKIISSFTNPLNAVLSDIINVATQATAVATLVENSAAGIGHILAIPGINLKNTLSALKNTAGVITRLPESVADAFKRNFHTGYIHHSAAILSSGPQGKTSKKAVLSSGTPHTVQNSFII